MPSISVDQIKELEGFLAPSSDLEEEFERCPSYYASATRFHAEAQRLVRKYEEKKEAIFSKLYSEYRKHDSKAKENDCKAYIRGDDQYQKVSELLQKYQYLSDLAKGMVRSFEMKRDMLIQRGAEHRSGIDSYRLGSLNKKKSSEERRRSAKDVIKNNRRNKESQHG